MPTLNRIGKDKVVNHHHDVPFKLLNHKYGYHDGKESKKKTDSGNMIIHGDNLEALKSLLPKYEGKIKCIYIDPPYNTGNEGRVYNDNVTHPKIKKRLGEVVGKEGEDLTRHDKWLCMMYPRLKLLHKLLRKDGVIFISLDDNVSSYLKLMMDEIFGSNCFQQQIIRKNKYGPGAMTKGFGNIHEYIFCYSKNPIDSIESNLSEDEQKKYKKKDEKFDIRGGYITQPLATKSKDDRPNLVYPIKYNGNEIRPNKQRIWSKERMLKAIDKNEVVIKESRENYSVRFKQYLKDEDGKMRKGKPISIMIGPYNQDGTKDMTNVFGKKIFDNPKPTKLIEFLLRMIFNGDESGEGIYLDSFAGSGTTAHAVMNLNKEDGGNRKFILIELMDYANDITAERVKRVAQGYGKGNNKVEGTGGSFDYYELGDPLFIEEDILNENVGVDVLREYIRYTETHTDYPETQAKNNYYLGTNNDTDYYFYYEKKEVTTLNYEFLSTLEKTDSTQYLIYADICALSDDILQKHNIIFKKIPRDISKI